jgi:hypothetical protein
MSTVLDDVLVGLALMASLGYAFATLSPRTMRRRLFGLLAEWLERAPRSLRLTAASQRLARAADEKPKGACGGCDGCGSEPKAQQTSAEIRVPLTSIARVRSSRRE